MDVINALLTLSGSLSMVVVLWAFGRILTSGSRAGRKYNLPPGPRPLPLVDNAFDMPTSKEWLTFTDWSRKYGPISHVKLMSTHVVVLGSYDAVYEVLVRQSKFTSNRPRSVMLNDIMGWGSITTLLDYGDTLREHRAIIYKYMQPSAAINYHKIQFETTYRMLDNMLESPKDFMHHIRRAASTSIMMMVYGHHVTTTTDRYITLADIALRWFSEAAVPGRYWVDLFPWLRYVPDWFPWTNWKNDGRAGFEARRRMYNESFLQAKMKASHNTLPPCIVGDVLSDDFDRSGNEKGVDFDEKFAIPLAGTLYAGGADTTVGLIQSTVLALVLEPSMRIRAQREIDQVIGSDRLPTIEDRDSLPYIESMVREALRWNPVVPLGITHVAETEIVVDGFGIPAGSFIIPNVWGILHDENMYPEPFKFYPERWLDEDGNLLDMVRGPVHPNKIAFGFGRRICPGRHLAENHLFVAIACLVSVFNFEKCRDDTGSVVEPRVEYQSGSISDPLPFECVITPRSSKCVSLVRRAVELLDMSGPQV